VSAFERIVEMSGAWDRRSKDPKKNYGGGTEWLWPKLEEFYTEIFEEKP